MQTCIVRNEVISHQCQNNNGVVFSFISMHVKICVDLLVLVQNIVQIFGFIKSNLMMTCV